ncbi:hypothetical protein LguiA_021763 [Lonicera macranthoides]
MHAFLNFTASSMLLALNIERKEFPKSLLKLNRTRSFAFEFEAGPISKIFLDTLIKTFKCLRVLDLSGSEFEELPSSTGTLTHLRYLSIGGNRNIKALPNTICNLVSLQTLDLNGCFMLQDVPRDFGNILSLRCLRLTSQMTSFPEKRTSRGLKLSLILVDFEVIALLPLRPVPLPIRQPNHRK